VRQQVEATPTNAGHLELLAIVLLFRGDSAAAVQPLLHAVELNPVYDAFSCSVAAALLQTGRDEQYLLYRHNYFERRAGHHDFVGDHVIARGLLLAKGDNEDFERACQFAELAITNVAKGDVYSDELVRALMEYRRGSYASAREWSNRVVTRTDPWLPRLAEGWFLQAMASARLERLASAWAALARGEAATAGEPAPHH